jgi:hypothetical protein
MSKVEVRNLGFIDGRAMFGNVTGLGVELGKKYLDGKLVEGVGSITLRLLSEVQMGEVAFTIPFEDFDGNVIVPIEHQQKLIDKASKIKYGTPVSLTKIDVTSLANKVDATVRNAQNKDGQWEEKVNKKSIPLFNVELRDFEIATK